MTTAWTHGNLPCGRRLKRMRVTLELLVSLFETREPEGLSCVGLPPRTKFVGARFVPYHGGINLGSDLELLVSHPEFDDLEESEEPPQFVPVFTRHHIETGAKM